MSIPGEGAGKGDSQRPMNRKRYDESWIRIFGKKCPDPACKNGKIKKLCVGEHDETYQWYPCGTCKGIGRVEK